MTRWIARAGLALAIAGAAAVVVSAQEQDPMTDDRMVVKPQSPGHQLLLPNDWPIEHAENGVIKPAAIEQYLSMKFQQVRARFEQTDRRIQQLETRLVTMEEERKTLLTRLRLLEERAAQPQPMEGSDAKQAQGQEADTGSQAGP